MKMGKTETSVLLEQCHEGDPNGLDTLVERHLPWIHDKVRQKLTPLLRGKGETCDYVQDAMVQFLRYGPRFTLADEEHFRAMMLRIVESTLLNRYDWFTAQRRAIARERPLPTDTVLSLDPLHSNAKTPSTSAQGHEQEAWIRLGIEFLDPEYREILVLRKWEDLSFNVIGERLGISSEAARKKCSRAINRLSDKVWELRAGNLSGL